MNLKQKHLISWLTNIEFENPGFFWLILIVPAYLFFYFKKGRKNNATLRFSSLMPSVGLSGSLKTKLIHAPFILRLLTLSTVVIILARPRSVLNKQEITSEGIDIVIATDISASMLAMDFEPNRFGASKSLAKEFINGRKNDRIGLVVFAGESFTQCPITSDHQVLVNAIDGVKMGIIHDGTAIGMGLITSVDRLSESEAKSKVIILLTDGVNNSGQVDPEIASESASKLGIRVYTIGVGTNGMAMMPRRDFFGKVFNHPEEVTIDETLLKKIAKDTGGDYFRATDNNKLREVFEKIDELETTRMEVASFRKYREEFLPFALAAIVLLLLEFVFKYLIIRRLP